MQTGPHVLEQYNRGFGMKFEYNNRVNEAGIYQIKNEITERVYIGQAQCFKKR